MNNSIQAVAKMMIRAGEEGCGVIWLYQPQTGRRKTKERERRLKKTKYGLVMPVDSAANYISLARSLWLYSNTSLIWWSDFQQSLTTQNTSEILELYFTNL